MLKPFRIRNLYFNSSDLIDCSGVVQLSSQQYDQEIQLTPEAVFAYLDEEDGETVTVGSSFELEQRLLEPPGQFSSWKDLHATDDLPTLHVFDIRWSTSAARAWHKYITNHNQPSASVPSLEFGCRPEKSKQNDYQSLLARFQVLELEVKLMKEAFKMKSMTTSERAHEAPQPVFAVACKNSDLFTPSTTREAQLPPAVDRPRLDDKHETISSIKAVLNPLQKSELHAPNSDRVQSSAPPVNRPSPFVNSSMAGRETSGCLDPSQFGHFRTVPSVRSTGSRSAIGEMGLFRYQNPDAVRSSIQALDCSMKSVSHDLHDSNKTCSQQLLSSDDAASYSTDEKPSRPSLQQMVNHLETANASSPSMASQQPSLKTLLDLEPEAEIARFPTIFQLEKEGLRSASNKSSTEQNPSSSNVSLSRANTVTASNPAARLLKPFDPATEGLGVSTRQNSLPRRCGTERHQIRPRAEQFSGVVRTLRKEFERPPSLFSYSQPRPLNVIPHHTSPPINRSQSLNHHHPSNDPQTRRLAPMRSAVNLVGTLPNQYEPRRIEPLGHTLTAATSDLDLDGRSANDSHPARSSHVQLCIRTLQEMGYKPQSRIPIYAEACDGDILQAITMAEEDEKASQETRSISDSTEARRVSQCVQQLKEMGYGAELGNEKLEKFARKVGGDVVRVVEDVEGYRRTGMDQLQERRQFWMQRHGMMPGSFP